MNKYIKYNDLTKEQKEMVDSENWFVRDAAANQGYGLDKLVDDEDFVVRKAVANQGYGLDKLVDDEDFVVRVHVANQGFGLDKLIDDKVSIVRYAVKNYLIDYDYKDINDWIAKNPDKCALSENMQEQESDD